MKSPVARPVRTRVLLSALCLASLGGNAYAEDPYALDWVSQIGTSGYDASFSVAVDASGNAYMSGFTQGSLEGTNAGGYDAFLTKFDTSGNVTWTQQIGTSGNDFNRSVAVDALGNAYISGYTSGSLGGTNAGGYDAFLTKFDTSGNTTWTRQIGTSSNDGSYSVAVDASGNAYISGYTAGSLEGVNAGNVDAFLTKFDTSGNVAWTQQIGTTAADYSYSVAVDASGSAYISGYTQGSLGGANAGATDAFLTKFDTSGNVAWTRQIGTSGNDASNSVAVDALGNAYISGSTTGSLGGTSAGADDAFLTKFDASGNVTWTQQIGTSVGDISYSVAVDASGNAYISGYTVGSLEGVSAGFVDAFLTKFDTNGIEEWTQQIGTTGADYGRSVAVDASGNAYISGYTNGSLEGVNAGSYDAFIAKFAAPVPEPSSLAMLALGGLALLRRRRR